MTIGSDGPFGGSLILSMVLSMVQRMLVNSSSMLREEFTSIPGGILKSMLKLGLPPNGSFCAKNSYFSYDRYFVTFEYPLI
jgi:hypothetical protein